VTLDAQGNGTCTCPDFQIRTSREGRLCKHVAAAAITSLVPLIPSPRAALVSPNQASQSASHPAEAATFVLRPRKKIQGEGKDGVEIEVAAKLTGDETQDRQTADAAFQLLSQVADGVPAKGEAPSGASAASDIRHCTLAMRRVQPMKRTNIYLSLRQWRRLQEESRRSGINVSELIRRCVDAVYPRGPNN